MEFSYDASELVKIDDNQKHLLKYNEASNHLLQSKISEKTNKENQFLRKQKMKSFLKWICISIN